VYKEDGNLDSKLSAAIFSKNLSLACFNRGSMAKTLFPLREEMDFRSFFSFQVNTPASKKNINKKNHNHVLYKIQSASSVWDINKCTLLILCSTTVIFSASY
jgi:hypothetical protein